MISLSIIVPVYNVEKYVRACVESLFRQGLTEDIFEVIIVNDGTEDNSMEVIADIINSHSNFTVINQQNQGLSVARNNGIAVAKGEYILLVDSDDVLVENSLTPILYKVLETNVDIAIAEFREIKDESAKYHQPTIQLFEETSGRQLFLKDFKNYVWHKLYKKKFLEDKNISFIPGIFYEDIPFTHECYLKAGKCLRTNIILYLYRKRPGSITQSYFNKEKRLSSIIAITRTMELKPLTENDIQLYDRLQNIAFEYITKFVCTMTHCKVKRQERNHTIDALIQSIPYISFDKGMKQKIISYMLQYMPHTYIQSRYYYGRIMEDYLLPRYHRIKAFIKRLP